MPEIDNDVMPAGSMIPEPEVEAEVIPDVEPEEPILGKFKSQEDLATAYTELEKKIGEQGNELGSMKSMNTMLLDKVNSTQAKQDTPLTVEEEDDFDYQGQLAAATQKYEDGDLSMPELMGITVDLATEQATRSSVSKYKEMNMEEEKSQSFNTFADNHPDFFELQQSGALEPVKKALPGMHDDFSAYFALKAQKQEEAAVQKAETERVAAGDVRTTKVLQKPGGNATKEIGKPKARLTGRALKAHTLAKLEAMG